MNRRPAVFVDRDGTINRNVFNTASGKWEAPLALGQVELLPGAATALRLLQEAGYALILVSNQPNQALGKSVADRVQAIHDRLVDMLAANGVTLTDAYYCYHHPNGHVLGLSGPCVCRKPSPYFLNRARDRHGLDMLRSWMVGDRGSDVSCGKRAGVRTIFLTSEGHIPPGPEAPQPDAVLPSLEDAARFILGVDVQTMDRAASSPYRVSSGS